MKKTSLSILICLTLCFSIFAESVIILKDNASLRIENETGGTVWASEVLSGIKMELLSDGPVLKDLVTSKETTPNISFYHVKYQDKEYYVRENEATISSNVAVTKNNAVLFTNPCLSDFRNSYLETGTIISTGKKVSNNGLSFVEVEFYDTSAWAKRTRYILEEDISNNSDDVEAIQILQKAKSLKNPDIQKELLNSVFQLNCSNNIYDMIFAFKNELFGDKPTTEDLEFLQNNLDKAYENNAGIPNGDYYVEKVIVTLPGQETGDYSNISLKVIGDKFFFFEKGRNNEPYHNDYLDSKFTKYSKDKELDIMKRYKKYVAQDYFGFFLFGGGASGFSTQTRLIYDGDKIMLYHSLGEHCKNSYAYIYIFSNHKTETEFVYDFTFPYYIFNYDNDLLAYSTKDFSKEPDITIPSIEVKYRTEESGLIYYYFSDENERDTIIVNDYFIENGKLYVEAMYHNQTIYIAEKDIPKYYIFYNLDEVKSVAYGHNGL